MEASHIESFEDEIAAFTVAIVIAVFRNYRFSYNFVVCVIVYDKKLSLIFRFLNKYVLFY